MEGRSVAAYKASSDYFLNAVELVTEMAWSRPGLGEWSVLELVGHASRAYTTVEQYLLFPVAPEPPGSSYFSPESIARRGREAVEALGNDPRAAARDCARRAIELVDSLPADATLGSPTRTMTLGEYLPSRTAELTIHTLDLLRACELEVSPPPAALEESLVFVAQMSLRKGSGKNVLLALSGREALPTGFSVY
jgi:uncharacterized protein (TIGR03083 family)